AGLTNCFQDTDCADSGHITSVFWNIKADPDVALCSQVIDFIGFEIVQEFYQIDRVSQVPVVQKQVYTKNMWILIQMIDSGCIECTGSADNSVNLTTFS